MRPYNFGNFFNVIKTICFVFITFFTLSSCNSKQLQETDSNYYITYLSGDLTIPVELKGNKIEFTPDFLEFKNDIVVLKYQTETHQQSVIVPAKNNALNQYHFVSDTIGKIPFVVEDISSDSLLLNNVSLQFGGNEYLEKYNSFINSTKNIEAVIADPENWLSSIISFSKNTKNSQIAGYLLYNTYNKFKNQNKKLAKEIEGYSKNHKGMFFEKIYSNNKNNDKKSDCIEHSIDTLIIQNLENTMIYPDYYIGKDIIIMVYWATWCGPCKPILKKLQELKLNKYSDRPVTIFAPSIDDDVRRFVNHISKDSFDMNILKTFVDNGCMQKNYDITDIPQIFIYDHNGHLISKNSNFDEVEEIVDAALNNR